MSDDTAQKRPLNPLRRQDASKALLDAWRTIRKRWVWVVTLAISGVVGVGFYTAGKRPIYRSTCVLQIDPTPPKPLGKEVQAIVDVGTGSFWANAEYYKTQFEIIQSRTVAEETVRRLGLHHDQAFLLGLSPGEPVPERANRGTVQQELSEAMKVEQAAGVVRSHLNVAPIKDSRLVTISFTDANPERARQVLATLVGVYVDRNIDVALASTNAAADWLRSQVDNLKGELETSENALQEYKSGHRVLSISLDDQSNMLRQEMQQLTTALTAVRVRRAQVEARATELAKIGVNDVEAALPERDQIRNAALDELHSALKQAEAEHASLIGAGKGEEHPLVASAAARVASARQALQHELQNIKDAAERELSAVAHEADSLAELLDQAQRRAQELSRLEVDYRRLERSKLQTEKLYGLVIERSKESDLTRMMRFNNIQTIDTPLAPKRPIGPNLPLNLALGLFAGLGLGLCGAFAREMFDQSVKSPQEIEQDLAMTFLGLLPRQASGNGPTQSRSRRRRAGREPQEHLEWLVHEDSTSPISEAARGIRTNLAFMSPDRPYRSFLITSASPSEGKTTVACWLATAMAQAGQRVLLVDCDLRRPRLHRIFDLLNDRGVTSVLVDRPAFKAAVHETRVPGLSVLLSGPASPNPSESLQSKSFENLLADALAAYDQVVLDSPPVGPVTDAVILSTRVDASILVVRAAASAREVVRRAKKLLLDVRAHVAGAILNAVDPGGHDYSYSYYRRYHRSEDTQAKTAS
jgi:succinoglycan biosynthesis transport protein ExoP